MIYLYNTLSRKKELFIPTKPGKVRIYSCGPTVYNRVHIGNIRAFIFADLLQRWFRFGEKMDVEWVMNITDVDDKTIRDSKKAFPDLLPKKALQVFTQKYADFFFEDLESVNIDKSFFMSMPFATHYIDAMKDLIQFIVDKGFAYVDNGSVYLDVSKYRKVYKYGELVTLNFDKMVSTNRVESDEYEKCSANDFVLWKGFKDGEPSWDFSLRHGEDKNGDCVYISLPGRPGWHIECSAMSKSLFPDFPFDIHTGGVDLCFPHHEDEICQARAGYGVDTANYWIHNEHLMVDGKKMSKSLGNFYTLGDLHQKGFSSDIIRFFLVTNGYRKKINISEDSLQASGKMYEKIREYKRLSFLADPSENNISSDDIKEFISKFYKSMRDDLNVSVAIAEFYSFMKECSKRRINEDCLNKFVETVENVENVFGISFDLVEKDLSDEVKELISERDRARASQDWALSDEIRDSLQEMGFDVLDTPNGTVVKESL